MPDLHPTSNKANPTTTATPADSNLSALPPGFQKCNHFLQPADSDEDLLTPQPLQFVGTQKPAEDYDPQYWPILCHFRLLSQISFSQHLLRSTSLFLLVPLD